MPMQISYDKVLDLIKKLIATYSSFKKPENKITKYLNPKKSKSDPVRI
jgi:hypothetical protein